MNGVERLLRRLLKGKRRRWTGIILSCAVLLVLGLPAADHYTALLRLHRDLAAALKQASEQVQRRDQVKLQADEAKQALEQLQRRKVVESDMNRYRSELAQQIRACGCQLRRLSMGPSAVRPWRQDSHPLTLDKPTRSAKAAHQKTEYQLRSQTVSLSVAGSHDQVRALLAKMHAQRTLMHTSGLSIRPAGSDRKEIVMEMDFILFGLEQTSKAPLT